MVTQQGSVSLLQDPVAATLLESTIPARLAYIGRDGAPRNIPIWFHWNGEAVVLASPWNAAKVPAISRNPRVALTIDGDQWPYKVLQLRGAARIQSVDGVVPEYALAAERYFGPEQGKAWIDQIGSVIPRMARITVTPDWAGVIDMERRLPNAIERAMEAAASKNGVT